MTAEVALDRTRVLAALDQVVDPRSGRGLAAAGLVRGLVVAAGRTGFMLEVAPADVELYAPVRAAAEAALSALPGAGRVHVALTADSSGGRSPAAPAPRVSPPTSRPAHVRRVIAIASGKGGVGKSTLAVNLACAFARLGVETGLLDADVYGPSAPRMMRLSGQRPEIGPDKRLIPLEAWGVRCASIGFMVDEGSAMIWRGPMASSAVGQLLTDVAWGSQARPLDLLVIDMPPGTGDVQLTLAQRVALDGAVIVSTPQEVALADVRRGAAMFAKTATPVLGVVENMAFFPDPSTGAPIAIFGRGGGRAIADEIGAPFLGEIPIDMALCQSGDLGAPLTAADPDTPAARALYAIAEAVLARLQDPTLVKPPPRIVIED